jgi:AraC family transcriptional regulator of adaptative response/methylated-DNA-[protein]-cysteine methyltransferase
MISAENKKEYYQAFIDKKTEYEGVFFVGVKTTGVFCRPTCSARKPKFAHCEFFETTQQAQLASFRPCKRCYPLSHPQQMSTLIQALINAIEDNPDKRWKDEDFRALSIDASTARRHFKKRFGMTFVEYARARRMELASKQIRAGEAIIAAQLSSGYESGSGFREAFSKIMGAAPAKLGQTDALKAAWIDTPLGPMIAIANEQALYLLEFLDRKNLECEVERLVKKTKSAIIPGHTPPLQSIEAELKNYFEGTLIEFKTPIFLMGSSFQKRIWEELKQIPFGHTQSYFDIANKIGQPTAFRAVANANGTNQFAIIIPCHRVVNSNGELGGYSGGLARKKWLINHEKSANFSSFHPIENKISKTERYR